MGGGYMFLLLNIYDIFSTISSWLWWLWWRPVLFPNTTIYVFILILYKSCYPVSPEVLPGPPPLWPGAGPGDAPAPPCYLTLAQLQLSLVRVRCEGVAIQPPVQREFYKNVKCLLHNTKNSIKLKIFGCGWIVRAFNWKISCCWFWHTKYIPCCGVCRCKSLSNKTE